MSSTSESPARVAYDEACRRERILDAANDCFTRLGIDRTSVRDVAQLADVSRGTIYRYFNDRDGLVTAAIEFGAQQFYRALADAMSRHTTLVKQLGAVAQTHALILRDHRTRSRLMSDDVQLIHHMVSTSGSAVERLSSFLVPYVTDAQMRGEVGARIDVTTASDWLARIIYSLAAVGSTSAVDLSRPETVAAYVEEFAINGLR